MRILNWLKSKLSGRLSTEELRKIPLMNERWICPAFKFPFPDSIFSDLSILYPGENPTREEVVMEYILPALGELGQIKKLACLVDKNPTPPTVLLRFSDRSKGDEELGSVIIKKDLRTSADKHRLSPIEIVKYRDSFHSIERNLLALFGSVQTREMVEFYIEVLKPTEQGIRKKCPMVVMTNHICYYTYPLEKWVELFSEHEEKAEKWLSDNLFGWSFKEFIDFIMEKEEPGEFMEMYCSEVRKLLEKYDIPVEQYQD